MLLDVVAEIAEWLAGGLVDWTVRGIVLASTLVSVCLAGAAAWLWLTSSDPANQQIWGVDVLVVSVCWGVFGLCFAVLHYLREAHDRLLSALCVVINAAAAVVPAFVILR